MTTPFDITPFLGQDEGQHFDRKSLLHGPPCAKRARNRREVRDQIAEYVAAFANAEGGGLGFRDPRLLVRRHLKPLVEAGRLERTHPESPSHPVQAYRRAARPGGEA